MNTVKYILFLLLFSAFSSEVIAAASDEYSKRSGDSLETSRKRARTVVSEVPSPSSCVVGPLAFCMDYNDQGRSDGCCSSHGGVDRCDPHVRRYRCKNGTVSPTCSCVAAIKNPACQTSICFTPGGRCTELIVDEINRAQKEILVRAFSFTSKPIADALIAARKRNVNVFIMIDRGRITRESSAARYLKESGVTVLSERASGYAHNKVMIIDEKVAITGSFNFTAAAQSRNAENVVVLRSFEAARLFKGDWINAVSRKTILF